MMRVAGQGHRRLCSAITLTAWLIRLTTFVCLLLLPAPWLPLAAQVAMPVSAACGHVGTLAGFVALDATSIAGSTDAGSMAYSMDGGHCWLAAALDLPLPHRLGDILRDPRRPNVILAGAGGSARIGIGGVDGLLRSGDGGRSWKMVGNGLPTIHYSVSALTATASGLFAAVTCPDETQAIQNSQQIPYQCGAPIYRSTDDGLLWRPVGLGGEQATPGLPGPNFDGAVLALTSASTGVLYAAVAPLNGEVGLYRSANQGRTWSLVAREDRLHGASALLVTSGAQPGILAGVGIFNVTGQVLRSADGGHIWQQVVSSAMLSTDIAVLNFLETAHGLYFAGLKHIFHSADEGLSWQQLPGTGLPDAGNALLGSTPSGALLLSKIGGFYRSDDAGIHWRKL